MARLDQMAEPMRSHLVMTHISANFDRTGFQQERIAAFKHEINELLPWYDMGKEQRGRTTLTHFEPETAAQVLCNHLSEKKWKRRMKTCPRLFCCALRPRI